MGRVFSLVQIIGTAVMPLGMVFFGPISDVVNVGLLLIITGILIVIISFIAQRNHKLLENG
jgi:DHA3 family macrolide efflux protein-like MFS transporter